MSRLNITKTNPYTIANELITVDSGSLNKNSNLQDVYKTKFTHFSGICRIFFPNFRYLEIVNKIDFKIQVDISNEE